MGSAGRGQVNRHFIHLLPAPPVLPTLSLISRLAYPPFGLPPETGGCVKELLKYLHDADGTVEEKRSVNAP